jgi:hypothetical protein
MRRIDPEQTMLNDASQVPGVYRFDAADAELSLLPMAARRALDCAGLHLSLKAWQELSLPDRRALTQLGAAEVVAAEQVARFLAERQAQARPTPPLMEAEVAAGPSAELLQGLPLGHALSQERWCQLSGLDRYVLAQLARRGKLERLAEAYAEICCQE